MAKHQTILWIVKIIIEFWWVRKCTKDSKFFVAPEESSFWFLSLEKPNSFVVCINLKACFVNWNYFITHILRFEFFLKLLRKASTFFWSCLKCWGLGVIKEKPSRCIIRSTWRSEYVSPISWQIIFPICFVLTEQYSLFVDLIFVRILCLSFARFFFVSFVGLPLRGKSCIMPLCLYLLRNLLTEDWLQSINSAISCWVLPFLSNWIINLLWSIDNIEQRRYYLFICFSFVLY